ncbi:MAG TPA: Chromate resistance protein ChrB [Ktedonobacteraceae bacterium]|nr:Chromate resistance protein ChrB [Ktedonobacteraceae bacterium]
MPERDAMRWLQLTYKVPSEPSQKRVWVWRRLQNLGAFALQNSVYLLPFTPEVEKRFRQLAQDVRDLGGEAAIFSVVALDTVDEQRILSVLLRSRESEYDTAISACGRFLRRTQNIIEKQELDDQIRTECTEALEKIHVLFRQAKRHDLLAELTAARRTLATEALETCEQIFRFLLNREYGRAGHALEAQSDLLTSQGDDSEASITSDLVVSFGTSEGEKA